MVTSISVGGSLVVTCHFVNKGSVTPMTVMYFPSPPLIQAMMHFSRLHDKSKSFDRHSTKGRVHASAQFRLCVKNSVFRN